MKQKREIIIVIAVAEDVNNERDAERLCKDLEKDVKEYIGEEDLLYIEYLDDEWGEMV